MELLSVGSSKIPAKEILPGKPQQQETTSSEAGKKTDKPVSKESIQKTIEGINEFLKSSHTSTRFVLHEKLNDYYVQIVDDATKEIMKEIPSKKFLDLYAEMIERVGLFIDKKI
ncbi:flagellar protein FlaG [Fictibacillus iocasae]|uniref:Flagellar protein FlaG n=1 Tax=Fictibacillus iocasae TaxID=2715437 RepID=A0ABW2NRD4_9BACL